MGQRPDVRSQTMQLLEETTAETLEHLSIEQTGFQIVQATKAKLDKWDQIVLGHVCTAKEMINSFKRRTEEQRKYLQTSSAKELIPRIYKEFKEQKNF